MKPTIPRLFYAHRELQTAQREARGAWEAYYAAPEHWDRSQVTCALNRATEAQSRAVRAQAKYSELKAKYNE
jgi:hypothetical protein